jgi:hypothetical protein
VRELTVGPVPPGKASASLAPDASRVEGEGDRGAVADRHTDRPADLSVAVGADTGGDLAMRRLVRLLAPSSLKPWWRASSRGAAFAAGAGAGVLFAVAIASCAQQGAPPISPAATMRGSARRIE